MASHLQQKRRRLEAVLGKLARLRVVLGEADRALAEYETALAHALGHDVEGMDDVSAIVLHICHEYGVTPAALMSRVRTAELVEPRHLAMVLAVILTPHSRLKLARYFQREPSTIQHAVDAHGSRIDTDRTFSSRVERHVRACQSILDARQSA